MVERIIGSAVDYSRSAPENFPHRTKIWEFLPMGSYNGGMGSSDIVRFNIKTDDFWDPYSTFIEIQLDVSQNPYLADDTVIKNKIIQLDSSASSCIGQMVISDNGEELERMQQYDILACILKDIVADTGDRYAKDYEGLGGTYNGSFVSTVTSVGRAPELNDGFNKSLKFWQPADNQFLYLDSLNSGSMALPQGVNGQHWTTANHIANMTQSGFTPFGNRVATTFNDGQIALDFINDFALPFADANVITDPIVAGIPNAYTPAFGSSGYEPCFSLTLNQRYMNSGRVKTGPVTSQTFQVPLMSAIFGHLFPPNCYKLIPMRFFRDLVFEFTFNPYAFFTSFMSTNSSCRGYTIKGIKIKTELVAISDPNILAEVQAQYAVGIKIPTQQWSMGPLCPISQGQVPPTVQINLGFESLRDILFCFIPNDYTANSACRKNYRLSMNITSMQLKVGTEYYPQQKISGNAGNNLGLINNNEFIKHLWKSFGKHVAPTASSINPHNFAVNCRAFDPTTTDPFFTSDLQLAIFEENRVIGKSVFSLNFDALNYENKMLSGLNTQFQKPFELLLEYDSTKVFPRPVTMYTFFRHDCALVLSMNGNKVYGRS